MNIALNEGEIKEAIIKYISTFGVPTNQVEISFTLGRKDTGLRADINIGEPTPITQVVKEEPVEVKEDNETEVKSETKNNLFL